MNDRIRTLMFTMFISVSYFVSVGDTRLSLDKSESHISCSFGQFLATDDDGRRFCSPCPLRHFMDEAKHKHQYCKRCSVFDEHAFEILVKNCTPESNIVTKCDKNRHKDWNNQCKLCSVCKVKGQYEAEPCRENRDTVCCPEPGMRAHWKDGEHKAECIKDSPTVDCIGAKLSINGCQAGEYLVSGCLDHYQYEGLSPCKQCKDGTFMNISRHNRTSCISCSILEKEASQILVSICNATHDNVYTAQSTPSPPKCSAVVVTLASVASVALTGCIVAFVILWIKLRKRKQYGEILTNS